MADWDLPDPVKPPPAMYFRLRWVQKGGHVHCRLFQVQTLDQTWQKNGNLVFDEASWPVFRDLMEVVGVQVLVEDNDGD